MSRPEWNERLVKKIKAAGQDLIDRAESFVSEDIDMVGDVDIWVRLRWQESTEIQMSVNTFCKTEHKLYVDGEL